MTETDRLKQLLNVALSTNNITIIYKSISEAIQESKKLGMTKVADTLKKAQSEYHIEEMKKHIELALKQVKTEEEKEDAKNEKRKPTGYLKSIGPGEYTEQYKRDREKYIAIITTINNKEEDIRIWPDYNENLHEGIKYGRWKGHLHARIDNNKRIMYTLRPEIVEIDGEKYNGNVIIFKRILTKNEFDSGK